MGHDVTPAAVWSAIADADLARIVTADRRQQQPADHRASVSTSTAAAISSSSSPRSGRSPASRSHSHSYCDGGQRRRFGYDPRRRLAFIAYFGLCCPEALMGRVKIRPDSPSGASLFLGWLCGPPHAVLLPSSAVRQISVSENFTGQTRAKEPSPGVLWFCNHRVCRKI